jgi:hypothetical protein
MQLGTLFAFSNSVRSFKKGFMLHFHYIYVHYFEQKVSFLQQMENYFLPNTF